MSIQVFNLHHVSFHQLAEDGLVLFLHTPLSLLKDHDSVYDAVVCHQSVTKDPFNIIEHLTLMIYLLI